MHDSIIVLPQYSLPQFQILRRRLRNGRHASLRVENVRQIPVVSIDVHTIPQELLQHLEGTQHGETFLVVSIDVHTIPQELLQHLEGTHHGETFLVHRRPPLL